MTVTVPGQVGGSESDPTGLKTPTMQGFSIYLLLPGSSAFAHWCSVKEEGLRISRAQSPQGLLGPYAKQCCTDEGENGHSQAYRQPGWLWKTWSC